MVKRFIKKVIYPKEYPITLLVYITYVFALFYTLGAWTIKAMWISFGSATICIIISLIMEIHFKKEVFYEEINIRK